MRLSLKHSTGLASVLFFVACSSVPDGAPENFHMAQSSIKEADKADVDDLLPKTVDRAEETLKEAVKLYGKSEDNDIDRATRDNLLKEASNKASEAKGMADQALALSNEVKSWDENIQQYRGYQQMSQELKAARDQLASAQQAGQESANAAQAANVPVNIKGPVAFFKSGGKNITGRFTESLGSMAQLLKSDPKAQVSLTGFTDSVGNPASNRELARARAESVADILKSLGVPEAQVVVNDGAIDKDANPKNAGEAQLARRVEAALVSGATEMTTSR